MISIEETKHIAGLSRIGTAEKDIEKFSADLSAILDWIKQLEEVDVKNVEPTAHISGIKNNLREDNVRKFLGENDIVKLFPEEKEGYDKVKSIL
jgi:aspartyl-tRNA(Asn)/glutamyl-tRNA(Gln) amidotransferase subunit C